MFKKLLVTILFILFFIITPKAFAAEDSSTSHSTLRDKPSGSDSKSSGQEFSTSYDVTYEVGTDGTTQVDQKITLKNLTDQFYASNFNLSIGSTTLTDVSSSDEGGPMETKVEVKDGKTSVTAKLNQQIVGLGKTQTLNLKFKSKDFAQNVGKTWEVNLPRIPESKTIINYNLTLSVPISFGDPTSISPSPVRHSETPGNLLFYFTKDQITSSGVSVNFGTIQIFSFNLKYNLENNSVTSLITPVTIPPDTDYQDIILNQLEPLPLNVTVDADGNYLAWYQLPPRSSKQVVISGLAKLYIKLKTKNPDNLTPKQVQDLTKSDKYWDRDNPLISSTLSEIFKNGKPQTNHEKVKLIYQYVVNTLKYDANRLNEKNIERLGALGALSNPGSAVCMEFTDLFIALTRAAGIPARALNGYAYSQNRTLRPLSLNKDLQHAWPEYFENGLGWVMVDPTWENTSGGVDYFNKFDLNHLVLAIKGISSESPNTTNNTEVEVSALDFSPKPEVNLSLDVPGILWVGLPSKLIINVSNQGNVSLTPEKLTLKSNKISILGSKEVLLGLIPPKGFTTYQVNLRTPLVWQSFEDTIEVSFGNQNFSRQIMVKPIFLFFPLPYLFASLATLSAITYLAILGFHIRHKKTSTKKK